MSESTLDVLLPREMFETVAGLLRDANNSERLRLVYFNGNQVDRSAPEYAGEREQTELNFTCLKELLCDFGNASQDSDSVRLALTGKQVWVIRDVLTRARKSERRSGRGSGVVFNFGRPTDGGARNEWQYGADFYDEILKVIPESPPNSSYGIDLRRTKARRRNPKA